MGVKAQHHHSIMNALIIDDSRTMREFISQVLKLADFSSDKAQNGQEALELIWQQTNYDLAIVDQNMPLMDGLTFLEEAHLREHARRPKVLMFSEECSPEIIAKALALGVDDFLMKPASPFMILCKLRLMGLVN